MWRNGGDGPRCIGKGAGALAGASKGKGKGLDAAAMEDNPWHAFEAKGNRQGFDAAAMGSDAMARLARVSGGVTDIVETGGSPTTAAAADKNSGSPTTAAAAETGGSPTTAAAAMASWSELLVDANSFVDGLLVNASYGPAPGATPVSMSLAPRRPGQSGLPRAHAEPRAEAYSLDCS